MKKYLLAGFGAIALTTLAACNNDDGNGTTIASIEGGENITQEELFDDLKMNQQASGALQNAFFSNLTEQLLAMAGEDMEFSEEQIDTMIATLQDEFGVNSEEELVELVTTNLGLEDRDDMVDNLIIPELTLIELQSQDLDYNEEDLVAYFEDNRETYEQVEARHIIVEEEDLANEIIDELNDGTDFAELAEEHGTDGTAATGGDLGFFTRADMDEAFAEAAFELEVGETTSEPVESGFGYHIIEKTDEAMEYEELPEAANMAVERAYIEENGRDFLTVIVDLLDEYDITIEDEFFQDFIEQIRAQANQPAPEEQPVEEDGQETDEETDEPADSEEETTDEESNE
ncbi:peptidylprolyl isomerase [Shouchella sp. JSM 1781072]|uniref:peptidylprolyl isomerase n=1 Tax=Bacillaceae TaxID=186817 RepID=UPI000C080E1D|nr:MULTISPECIES: peptidylprolyl isomerase [Bacillaceae]UTR07812.1 peptidylprolyl isomerase [Alkalihalobacillus sp. LMS6]